MSVFDWFQRLRMAFLYRRAGMRVREVSGAERAMTFTVQCLVDDGFVHRVDARYETWVARDYPNLSSEVKYTYEPPDAVDGDAGAGMLLICRAERERSAERARIVYDNGLVAYNEGVARGGGRLIFKGNLQRWSDEAFCSFLLDEDADRVTGCLVSFLKGRLVYTVILRDVLIDDEAAMERLLYPLLDRAQAWASQ